jgi:hypothetical protein
VLSAYEKPPRQTAPAAAFLGAPDELRGLYERQPYDDVREFRGALGADDGLRAEGREARFRVRETPDWKRHAGELESEMLKRGMFFEIIDWSEDQASLPFE